MTKMERVLKFVRVNGKARRSDVAEGCGMTPKQAKQALERLRNLGWIGINRDTTPATYRSIRDGEYKDGRGKGPGCAIGRDKRAANIAKAEMCSERSPWKFPPVPELERVWAFSRSVTSAGNSGRIVGGNVRPQET